MKITKDSTVKITIIIATLIFLGLSFTDFYVITTTGSVLSPVNDGYIQSTERTRNTMVSIVCSLIPFINLIIKKKWTRLLAIFASIVNLLIITLIYPTLVSASSSIISGSHSASLTSIGWIATIILVIIIFLLFF